MKSKDRENLRNHSAAELRAELSQTREQLFRLKFKHKVAPAKNPLALRNLSRQVARLETWIREKEISATAAPQAAPQNRRVNANPKGAQHSGAVAPLKS